jgi:hypothetical protein
MEASRSLQKQPIMHETFINKLLSMYCPYGSQSDQRMDTGETATELCGVRYETWLLWLSTSPKESEVGASLYNSLKILFSSRKTDINEPILT